MIKGIAFVGMAMLLSGCLATYGGKDPKSASGQLVSYAFTYSPQAGRSDATFQIARDGKITEISEPALAAPSTTAVFRLPPNAGQNNKVPAVVVLHDGGGWTTERTRKHSDILIQNGYATIEPRLFANAGSVRNFDVDLASTYGALRFLTSQPGIDASRIYAMGGSNGAMLAILTKTEMASQRFNQSGASFRAVAALYPVCWILSAVIDGKPPVTFQQFTPEDLKTWLPTPTLVLVPGLDDYDDRDPNTCRNFIDKIPSRPARDSFSVTMYPGATHGWDHGQTYSFYSASGCKGRGCTNTNVFNPTVTNQAYEDVLKFFAQH